MSDKIFSIKESTLTKIGNSIRLKTGSDAKIDPDTMPEAIESIEGGGASGCVVVNFLDGDVTLYSRPVFIGDDCPDPVTQGRIDVPVKESTESTVYTFDGWGEGALENITESKNVYAIYKEATRTYRVRFYDGDTLLNTEHVQYGGSSSYVAKKDNHLFTGWEPKPVNIQSDIDCFAQFEESYSFADASWEYISRMSQSGKAKDVFALGDAKDIVVTYEDGTSETVTLEVAGFDCAAVAIENLNQDDYAVTWSSLVIVAKHILSRDRSIHNKKESFKFPSSTLGTWLNGEFLNSLPIEMQSVLVPFYSGSYTSKLDASYNATYTPILCKVTLPSSQNTYPSGTSNYERQGFRLIPGLASSTQTKKARRGNTTFVGWWLASDYTSGADFYYKSADGIDSYIPGHSYINSPQKGVLPMFCV